mmetsp:Transcript_4138/g.3896  ORF Transcript_4138/g.3896 Transcript_4138/m.3896 type:complete len:131 (-) Transcript_4138:132-524(-)
MFKSLAIIALATSATAFAPAMHNARASTAVFIQLGEYDDQLWSNDAKKDVYAKWNPAAARSTLNFNPFETFDGNSPDASGIFPGEPFYKDPIRPDVSYALMLVEKAEIEERSTDPKFMSCPGAAGCKNAK